VIVIGQVNALGKEKRALTPTLSLISALPVHHSLNAIAPTLINEQIIIKLIIKQAL
jgi:hypothetical protein